jgi:hypothetical protein
MPLGRFLAAVAVLVVVPVVANCRASLHPLQAGE